ncbi:hypothetical protein GXP67_03005 [Rhodocytophaga rosea]|uniref:Uncharacterized protein n=1 Tax=Rhodocytophaga rosea TaxID=2704465 RepID=A0A6C0GCM1_9BACT|nr:hypothetical protein [Rhodocytophaga rosea]QHT65706.1 hypothetical protein GXP67_03005 [Rhodocytophaga rosea]
MKSRFIISILILSISCSQKSDLEIDTKELIRNIDRYHLDTLAISGKVIVEFENVALYLDDIDEPEKALWLNSTDKNFDYQSLKNKEVIIRGVIDKNDKGHLNQFLGSIEIIEVIEK